MLAFALLCTQLLTAAYACPVPAVTGPTSTTAMASMPDCDAMSGLDPDQPQLCKAHCDRDRQTVNNAPAPELPPSPVILDWLLTRLLTRLALEASRAAAEALPAVIAAHTGPPAGDPPVYLALQVLRH